MAKSIYLLLSLIVCFSFSINFVLAYPVASGFDYPVGKPYVTGADDGDGYYVFQNFKDIDRGKYHLGEDWNGEGKKNTDCGDSVYSIADGKVLIAFDYGNGWGNVIIIRHKMPDKSEIESLYGHLNRTDVSKDQIVKKGQQIGTIGDGYSADGCSGPTNDTHTGYWAHLHFEIRYPNSSQWGKPGYGRALDTTGWIDPSDFIDKHRVLLIKSSDKSTVYLFQNHTLYAIKNEPTFNLMSPIWKWENIINYNSGVFNTKILPYKKGHDFLSDGLLIKLEDQAAVYLIDNGQKRAFHNYDAFTDYKFNDDDIIKVTQAVFNSLNGEDKIYGIGDSSGKEVQFEDAFIRGSGVDNLGYAKDPTEQLGSGQIQYFQRKGLNSAIVFNQNKNTAYPVYGAIYNKYIIGAAQIYGYPAGDENWGIDSSVTGTKPRYQKFEGGSNGATTINHHFTGPKRGITVETHGPILDKWASMGLGYGASCAGLPISDIYASGGGLKADFENGYLFYNGATTIASCEATCTDECTQGATHCAISIVKQTCGNYDVDICSEWGGDVTCTSGCELGLCKTAPSCSDGIKNQDETDRDCGGSCTKCLDNKLCLNHQDCQNNYCSSSYLCTSASCSDGVRNGNELGIDCGGSCTACTIVQCDLSSQNQFRVNTYTQKYQERPKIATDSVGNFVVVWSSEQDSDGTLGIYAKIYNKDGSLRKDEFRVNENIAGNQLLADVAMDSQGDFIVVWEDRGSYDIYAQRYNSNGEKQDNNFLVNTNTELQQAAPSVAMDSQGNFVIAWAGVAPDIVNHMVVAKLYDKYGNVKKDEFGVGRTKSFSPDIAMDSEGNFVITWWDWQGSDGDGNGIFAKRYDKDGNILKNEFQVNTNTIGHQNGPAIAMDAEGNFAIAWQDSDQNGNFIQLFNKIGEKQGVDFRIDNQPSWPSIAMSPQGNFVVSSWRFAYLFDKNGVKQSEERFTEGALDYPVVAMDSENDFIVAWQYYQDPEYKISARIYTQNCPQDSCYNKIQDGNEIDVDCGGSCSACVQCDPIGNDELTMNTYIQLGQVFPAIAMDNDGDSVVAWHSYLQDGDADGVFAQRFNSNGEKQGPEFQVNTYIGAGQMYPDVAIDINGNFVITWVSFGQPGGGLWDIYFQRFNSNGEKQGNEIRVNSYTSDLQQYPTIAMDPKGNFVVVWQSNGQDGFSWGIYAQRYDAQGNPQGPEFRVNSYTANEQDNPDVAMDSEGNFAVTWYSNGQDGDGGAIYAQRYDAQGNPQGPEFLVNSNIVGGQMFPSIVMDSNGNFIITWQSKHSGMFQIYAQRFNSNGDKIGGEFRVNTATNPTSRQHPNVAIDYQGNFVITWRSDFQEGFQFNIYARRFDKNGNPLGNEFRINTYMTNEDDDRPVIAMNSKNNFIVAWHSWRQDVQDRQYDIIGKAFKCFSSCENGVKDPNEMDIDCGGNCPACQNTNICSINLDCQTGYCNPEKFCSTPSCFDGWRNGNEQGIDCGGNCNPCPEANNNPSGANILHLNSQGSETLNSITDMQDWWVIPGGEVINDGFLTITLSNFKSSNQDFDLYVYEDDASTQICSSISTNPSELCNTAIKAGKSYYIKVQAHSGTGSYQIQNTFTALPNLPGQVINLGEVSHTDSTICIAWNKPISGGGVKNYHVREEIKATDTMIINTVFCRDDFPSSTPVKFSVEACNADGCSPPSEIIIKTDPSAITSSIPKITSFALSTTKIDNKFNVIIKGSIENEAGVINNPDLIVRVNVLSDKLALINSVNAQLNVVDAKHANFESIWIPETIHYGSVFVVSAAVSDGDKKTIKEERIYLNVLGNKKVCIDAGHGGSDSGNVGYDDMFYNTTRKQWQLDGKIDKPNEADFNLLIALELKNLLKDLTNINMTREEDVKKTLDERTTFANNAKCDIFLSIHNNAANSSGDSDPEPFAHGTETYYRSDKTLATYIHKELIKTMGRRDRGVKYADFYVLRNTNMPSALTEIAFSTNDTEFNLLNTETFRKKAAQGLLNGIESYFVKRGALNLTIITKFVNSYSPFKIQVSITDSFGELTSFLNDKKIDASNFEVYLVQGELLSPEDQQPFTVEEISTGIFELTIKPEGQEIGETSDLYISLINPEEPEGEQLSGLAIAPESVYISDSEGKPIITLISPIDNSKESGYIGFQFKVGDDSNIESCSLLINNEIRETLTSVIKDAEQTFEQMLEDGAYSWEVVCRDEINTASSQAYSLFIETDSDNDGILDKNDNCPLISNPSQLDKDKNEIGDACNDFEDSDNDEFASYIDNCPLNPNMGQEDNDMDNIGNICDNCPAINNPEQEDTDEDGEGDACDICPEDLENDIDKDSICGNIDNCPLIANPNQEDLDKDGIGDACDSQTCNNNILETGEECDTSVAKTCNDLDFDAGTLACSSSCKFDTSQCIKYQCGNNKIEGTEECDGTDLAGQTCQTQGFKYGNLLCKADCTDYNKAQCANIICGNNILDFSEECDDGNLINGDGCSSSCKKEGVLFLRGDSNVDGNVDLSDAIFTLSWLFTGGEEPKCKDALDSNDDGKIDLSDGIYTLNFLFTGGPIILLPYPNKGIDPTLETPELGCISYNPVSGGGGSVETVKDALNNVKSDKTMPNQTKSFITNYLEEIPKGSLSLTSYPSSAYIYLDNSYKGLTSKSITALAAGNYAVKLTKYGYKDYNAITNIQSGKESKLSITLQITASPSPSPSPSPNSSPY